MVSEIKMNVLYNRWFVYVTFKYNTKNSSLFLVDSPHSPYTWIVYVYTKIPEMDDYFMCYYLYKKHNKLSVTSSLFVCIYTIYIYYTYINTRPRLDGILIELGHIIYNFTSTYTQSKNERRKLRQGSKLDSF